MTFSIGSILVSSQYKPEALWKSTFFMIVCLVLFHESLAGLMQI